MNFRDTSHNFSIEMSDHERVVISSYIENEFGIKMPESKKALLSGRLIKRLRTTGYETFGKYFEYIRSPKGKDEYLCFIDLISTHETKFFREPAHFNFLISEGLPALYRTGAGSERELQILSAACSTGEEVYSAACAIENFAQQSGIHRLKYRITGIDISSRVIKIAARGVYGESSVKGLPAYARRYFMRSKNRKEETVRIVPEIRSNSRFIEMNLIDREYHFDCLFDIIFCRNVMIYFDRAMQESVAGKLCQSMTNGGYIIVGQSETLTGFNLPISIIAPATYLYSR